MYTLLLNKYNNLLQPKYHLQKLKVRSSLEIKITTLSAPKPYTRPLLFTFASIQHPFLKVDDPVYLQLQFVESFYTLPISSDTSPTRYKSLTIHIQLLTGIPYIYIYIMRVKTLTKRNNMIYQLFSDLLQTQLRILNVHKSRMGFFSWVRGSNRMVVECLRIGK